MIESAIRLTPTLHDKLSVWRIHQTWVLRASRLHLSISLSHSSQIKSILSYYCVKFYFIQIFCFHYNFHFFHFLLLLFLNFYINTITYRTSILFNNILNHKEWQIKSSIFKIHKQLKKQDVHHINLLESNDAQAYKEKNNI